MPGRQKSYVIDLADSEAAQVRRVASSRKSPHSQVRRAQIVLTCWQQPTWTDEQVAQHVHGSAGAVRKWRKRWTETRSLAEAPRSGRPRVFSP